MRASLADRRGEFNQNMLVEEYNRGRLYRFSVDDRTILKTLATEEEGQLFIDMKDFTRKTLKVKEIAMAEFMNEHFYKPILSRGPVQRGHRGLKRRARHNPYEPAGDAAIFSGGVSYLIRARARHTADNKTVQGPARAKLPPMRNEEISTGSTSPLRRKGTR